MLIRTTRSGETSLYLVVKAFLERRGFIVKGEVCGCDIVAMHEGEPPVVVVTELKMAVSLELVLQGVARARLADEVWLAVRATRRGRDQDHRVRRLCRLLGFGLLLVDPARGWVEIVSEPLPYRPRRNLPKRARVVREFKARRGDPNPGGSSRQPLMTAYRQQALACAAAMVEGPKKPRDLKPIAPDHGGMRIVITDSGPVQSGRNKPFSQAVLRRAACQTMNYISPSGGKKTLRGSWRGSGRQSYCRLRTGFSPNLALRLPRCRRIKLRLSTKSPILPRAEPGSPRGIHTQKVQDRKPVKSVNSHSVVSTRFHQPLLDTPNIACSESIWFPRQR